ncbi:MAG: gamma-glutamyltransferase [Planctomycetes bacterium]|nr:gamma-glutamyltransferase [Planctomycetota bacterium]
MERVTVCIALIWAVMVAVVATPSLAHPPSTRPAEVVYQHAAVAADHPIASQAGVEMLKLGGNAVDAAVATSFCLSVVRPYSCGIGGGGFMVIYKPARDGGEPVEVAINYRETAPVAVGPNYYVRLADATASRAGYHAVGVPGTVAGLLWALEHHGTLDRAAVLAPAIRAAEHGFAADHNYLDAARGFAQRLHEHPHLKGTSKYLWETMCLQGKVNVGDLIKNPQQARALRLIADRGAEAFYTGEIAEAIVASMSAHDGPITKDDLAGYTVRTTKPLRGTFRARARGLGLEVLSMPPPSSGGIAMLQILGIFERRMDDLSGLEHNRPEYVHLLVEAMKHAFADRAQWLADPAFAEVPTRRLLESGYLDRLADSVSMQHTLDRFDYGSVAPAPQDGGTSHISVIDADGMAVACTETINLIYGSLVMVPGFGFALNNQMDDFTTVPGQPNAFGLRQSDRNLPAPGKRPLSSMSPTIVLRNGKPIIIAGASGGPRIITGTVQCVLNCLLFDMTPAEAVAAPRFHHQWLPNVLQFEDGWTDECTIGALKILGHEVGRRDEVGVVQLIQVTAEGIRAASDPRKGGQPAGY